MTYRLGTVVGAGALAVLVFSQGSQWWDIVGAVLMGSAIADVILLIAGRGSRSAPFGVVDHPAQTTTQSARSRTVEIARTRLALPSEQSV